MKINNAHAAGYLFAFCCAAFIHFGCNKGLTARTFKIYTPIWQEKTVTLSKINGSPDEPIVNTGKIYIKDKLIFLNEMDKGIHVVDNTNPIRPVQVAFLAIPGNADMAIKDNTLYADMYGDLLVLDISDVQHVTLTTSLTSFFMFHNGEYIDKDRVIIGWTEKDTTVFEETPWIPGQIHPRCMACYAQSGASPASTDFTSKTGSAKTGTAGSMARMVLLNDYLYAITEPHTVSMVYVSNAAHPVLSSSMLNAFDLETIYPFQNKLFLGSATGMFMFDVSDPLHPAPLGQFSHGRACDPVVADGKYAYVTLHTGTYCGGNANELDVINIEDLLHPVLIKSYGLNQPMGLSLDANLLFVCDGHTGVNVYDASNPMELKLLQLIECNEPYDVIAQNNNAIVVGKKGIYQFDYSDPGNIHEMGAIVRKD